MSHHYFFFFSVFIVEWSNGSHHNHQHHHHYHHHHSATVPRAEALQQSLPQQEVSGLSLGSSSGNLGALGTGTAAGGRSRYRTLYACEGSSLEIVCEEGSHINLIRANFGRYSISVCNEHGNVEWSVDCMSHRSFQVIRERFVFLYFFSLPVCFASSTFNLKLFKAIYIYVCVCVKSSKSQG